jgi:hypothetical protein
MRCLPVVLVPVALLVGCTADSGQDPVSGAAPASSTTAHADPIPPVRDPKNLAGTPPCALLTPVQLAQNRIDLPGQTKDVLGAPGCKWDNKAHTQEIAMWMNIGTDVLHNLYVQRATFPIFEIADVAGHPAIRTKDLSDGASCNFVVAAAERQALDIRFTSLRQGLEEPCGPARELAEAVLANLPPLKG